MEDRGQLDLVECFVVDFPPKVRVARLPVPSLQSNAANAAILHGLTDSPK